MSELMTGNRILWPGDGYSGEYSSPLPGYRFFLIQCYALLSATPKNRFDLWVPSQDREKSDKKLMLPHGAQVYHAGIRSGEGAWSEAVQELTLTAVSGGAPITNQSFPIVRIKPSSIVTGAKHLFLNATTERDDMTRTILFRDARTSGTPWSAATFDPFNAPISEGLGDDQSIQTALQWSIELQCRTPTALLSNTNALLAAGAGTGGLRQNLDPKLKDKGYLLLQVGYYMRDNRVVTAEDFAGVVWSERFKYV
jgi:hypothetical protein